MAGGLLAASLPSCFVATCPHPPPQRPPSASPSSSPPPPPPRRLMQHTPCPGLCVPSLPRARAAGGAGADGQTHLEGGGVDLSDGSGEDREATLRMARRQDLGHDLLHLHAILVRSASDQAKRQTERQGGGAAATQGGSAGQAAAHCMRPTRDKRQGRGRRDVTCVTAERGRAVPSLHRPSSSTCAISARTRHLRQMPFAPVSAARGPLTWHRTRAVDPPTAGGL